MVAAIGHFLFQHRNSMFPVACLPLLLPGPDAFDDSMMAALCGGAIALLGQVIRALTIGLRYVIRGGRGRRVYAEDLVTDGLYAHTRNPMYLGNLLIVAGVAVASNSWTTVVVGIVLGCFLYVCIVAAEEQYLVGRFGTAFREYCRATPRWFPNLAGLSGTLSGMRFAWRRVLVKEYGTPLGWIMVIVAITLFNVWSDGQWNRRHDGISLVVTVAAITIMLWFVAWRLKKSRMVVAD
jgi:protein-S-isoprenylcysteine O-methyltransferase Ste14